MVSKNRPLFFLQTFQEESEETTKLFAVHHVRLKIALVHHFSGVSFAPQCCYVCQPPSVWLLAGTVLLHVLGWRASSSNLEDDQLGATGSAGKPKPTANKHARIRTLTC